MICPSSSFLKSLDILPDSGANISTAGPQFVQALRERMDNLVHSNVSPKAVNDSILNQVGNIPKVAFCTNGRTVYDDVHIYAPVTGALISWATAKKLGILPVLRMLPQANLQDYKLAKVVCVQPQNKSYLSFICF
jgi:hypothetical protein